jgi:ribosomal protein S18 acetylase RimI-like enzyme
MTTDVRPVSTRALTAAEVERHLGALVELLSDVVNGGHPMGFLPPLSSDEGTDYWLSLRSELDIGARVLVVACIDERLVGSGQLMFARSPNGRHRAELQKLLVARDARQRGVGRALMAALHESARQHGRSLLMLYTRVTGGAVEFYKELGYREVGVIPGYTLGRLGERHDTLMLYQELSL